MARNYAALPHDYIEEMELLNDTEFGRICRALLKYSRDGEVPALSGSERVLFPRVKMQEDRFKKSYEEMLPSKREAGKKGASARWDNKDSKTQQGKTNDGKQWQAMADDSKNGKTETKTETKTKTKTETPPSTDGRCVGRAKRFTPPTLEEVTAYVAERNSPVIPQEFIDFYASKNWMVGKNKMTDWKAACRNAEKWDRWAKCKGKSEETGSRMPSDDIGRMMAEGGGFHAPSFD